jgi:hypothetical protein
MAHLIVASESEGGIRPLDLRAYFQHISTALCLFVRREGADASDNAYI